MGYWMKESGQQAEDGSAVPSADAYYVSDDGTVTPVVFSEAEIGSATPLQDNLFADDPLTVHSFLAAVRDLFG